MSSYPLSSSLAATFGQPLAQAATIACEKIDAISQNAALKILASGKSRPSASKAGIKDNEVNQSTLATLIKVSLIVLSALSAWVVLSHPILSISATIVGAIVNLEAKTKATVQTWMESAKPLVLDPILENETPAEKAALSFLAMSIVGIAATTMLLPTLLGIVCGYKLRAYLLMPPQEIPTVKA